MTYLAIIYLIWTPELHYLLDLWALGKCSMLHDTCLFYTYTIGGSMCIAGSEICQEKKANTQGYCGCFYRVFVCPTTTTTTIKTFHQHPASTTGSWKTNYTKQSNVTTNKWIQSFWLSFSYLKTVCLSFVRNKITEKLVLSTYCIMTTSNSFCCWNYCWQGCHNTRIS